MQHSPAGRRATVMGLGTFGGGIAAVRFLAEAGAHVTVTDLRTPAQLSASVAQIAHLPNVRLRLGGHDKRDFLEADLVVVSPSVRPGNRFVTLAAQAGAEITSEIRLFWERCPAPIVGITGSNGKSTTATLIRDVLAADGRTVWLGGNIGRSLLGSVESIAPADWVVLELSSFQLADLDVDRRSPHVAVVTNLTPNHLDWHGSLRDYIHAKQALLRWQQPDDLVVRRQHSPEAQWPSVGRCCFCGIGHAPDALVRLNEAGTQLTLSGSGETIDLKACAGLVGGHLRTAALLAATTGVALEVAPHAIRDALQGFTGLPHRLQHIGVWNGRTLINDSASTTPESTIAALHAVGAPVVLIVGGAEKGCPLEPLAEAIVQQTRAAVVIGDVREKLVGEVRNMCSGHRHDEVPPPLESITPAETLPQAVHAAMQRSAAGDAILFSPGFASGSMFVNFEQRGRAFVDLVANDE